MGARNMTQVGQLTFTTLWANSADNNIFLIFPGKQDLTFQILFSKKNKKNILKYCLLKILLKSSMYKHN